MRPFGNTKVESWIVDADDNIGAECGDILLAGTDIAEDGFQVHSYLDKAHDGKIADMADGRFADGFCHHIATPIAEDGLGVGLPQGANQVGAIEVARGFTGYEVVFHCSTKVLDFNRYNMKAMKVTKSTTMAARVAERRWCLA